MRLAGLLLGVIGSTIGLLVSISLVVIVTEDMSMRALLWFSVICFFAGLVSSSSIMRFPKTSGKITIAAAVGGLLFGASAPYLILMEGLMVMAGIFAIIGAKELPQEEEEEEYKKKEPADSQSLFQYWLNVGKK